MRVSLILTFVSLLSISGFSNNRIYTIYEPNNPKIIKNGHLKLGGTAPNGDKIDVNNYYITINGKPMLPVLGEFHYCRYPREQWEDEILKMKAGGVNVIPTYVFWNVHEPYEGKFYWEGNNDLRAFIELCAKHDIWSIVRIGPWCHGEMRNGGFPDWLFTKPLETRSNDKSYLHYVGLLYDQIAEQLKGLYYKDGGPIIGIQIENEHQASGAPWALSYPGESVDWTSASYDIENTLVGVAVQDKNVESSDLGDIHMMTLLKMAKERGIIAPLYTATGWGNAAVLGNEGIPVTSGYPYPVWLEPGVKSNFCLFKDIHKEPDYSPVRYTPEDYPSFSVEMGAGIQIIYDKRPIINPKGAEAMIIRCLGGGANAIGYYMYHGGSSPLGPDGEKFLSDGNPKITYDFQAPIGEYGLEKPVYRDLRILHNFIADFGSTLAPMETILPDKCDTISSDNRDVLRFCARMKDGSGFLFIINFQDHDSLRHKQNAKVDIKLKNETIRIPVNIAKDEVAILPFNLKMGNITLKYATAQLMMKIKNHYFFFAPNGMPSEYIFEDGKRFTPKPGFNSSFNYNGITITTLTREQAENALRVGEKIIFTESTAFENCENRITLLNLDNPHFTYTIFDGKFKTYNNKVETVNPEFKITKHGKRRYTVNFPTIALGNVQEYFLDIDYTGDIAIGFLNNKVIADNLWQGENWLIGLNRFNNEMQNKEMCFYFRPLQNDAPFLKYLPDDKIPDLSNGAVLKINKIKVIPQYKYTISLK